MKLIIIKLNLLVMNAIELKRKTKKIECVKHVIFLGLVLLTNITVFGQNQEVNDEVKRSMTRAKAAYEIGEYQDALIEYQKVSKLVPDFFDIHKAIGDTYEKMGGEENLKNAINSYKRYLSLALNAEDKSSIQEKIDRLGYLSEKQAQKDFILDDIKGLWVSNLVNISDKEQRDAYFSQMVKEKKLSSKDADALKTEGLLLDTLYRVDTKETPLLLFRITEMGKTGKFRVEILKESAFYKESIIQKIVNVVPDKNNAIRFTFADEAKYIPSQSKWNALRDIGGLIGSAIGGVGGDITSSVTNAAANAGQESDLPSNTQTVYDFELQYNDGKLTGYCNVIQGYSSAKITQDRKNDFYEIEFWKDNDYLAKLQLFKDKEEQKKRDKKAKKLVSFGFHAGLGINNFNYDDQLAGRFAGDYLPLKTELGFRAGVFLEFRLSDLLSIRPGLNIATLSGDPLLEIPINLLFKYNFDKSRLYAGIGPVINERSNTNVGLDLKAGYSVHKFFMEAGYNSGGNYNISYDDYNDYNDDWYSVNKKIKFSSFYISLGLKF